MGFLKRRVGRLDRVALSSFCMIELPAFCAAQDCGLFIRPDPIVASCPNGGAASVSYRTMLCSLAQDLLPTTQALPCAPRPTVGRRALNWQSESRPGRTGACQAFLPDRASADRLRQS